MNIYGNLAQILKNHESDIPGQINAVSEQILDPVLSEIDHLRAQNVRLLEALQFCSAELERIWDEFEIGDEFPRTLSRDVIAERGANAHAGFAANHLEE